MDRLLEVTLIKTQIRESGRLATRKEGAQQSPELEKWGAGCPQPLSNALPSIPYCLEHSSSFAFFFSFFVFFG